MSVLHRWQLPFRGIAFRSAGTPQVRCFHCLFPTGCFAQPRARGSRPSLGRFYETAGRVKYFLLVSASLRSIGISRFHLELLFALAGCVRTAYLFRETSRLIPSNLGRERFWPFRYLPTTPASVRPVLPPPDAPPLLPLPARRPGTARHLRQSLHPRCRTRPDAQAARPESGPAQQLRPR